MARLADVTIEELQEALSRVERSKPTQRLTAAIAYKHGVTQTELAKWYDVQRRTVYNWLTQLETEPIMTAVRDEHRSGRPRKLTDEQRTHLEKRLQQSPTAVGFDASAWTPRLVCAYVDDHFGVAYSRSSCRRLLNELR